MGKGSGEAEFMKRGQLSENKVRNIYGKLTELDYSTEERAASSI